jgi:hypothetical protein
METGTSTQHQGNVITWRSTIDLRTEHRQRTEKVQIVAKYSNAIHTKFFGCIIQTMDKRSCK